MAPPRPQKEFYNFKELEKLAPKQKGIGTPRLLRAFAWRDLANRHFLPCGLARSARAVAQSVKEVLDSLLADNIVDTDKIGTSVYYWAFPSKASQIVRRRRPAVPRVPRHGG